MATREHFSVDTNGSAIQIASVATPGTLVHTNADSVRDEVWASVTNTHTADEIVNCLFGDTGTNSKITLVVPTGETMLLIPGLRMGSAGVFRVWAATTTNKFRVAGYYNRLV